jgi:hypothetical protein
VSKYFRGLLWEAQEREQDARLEGLASKRIKLDGQFRQSLEGKVEQILEKYKDCALGEPVHPAIGGTGHFISG